MALTENNYTGNGVLDQYSFSFPYIDESDIKVSLDGIDTNAYSLLNATTILFDTPPALDVLIRIYRFTDVDNLKATFFAGSSIRSQDLNDNFLQNNYRVQELTNNTWDNETQTIHSDETWVSSDTQIATTAALDQRFQDEADETIESTESWVSDDNHIATTAAIDAQVDTKIDVALTNDIGTDGTGVTVTDDGDGTITLGIGVGTIDLDRIKDEDIVTYAEQNAGSPSWDSDARIPTTYAAAKRFDTLVQTATPTGTDWEVGKTWLQNDANKTLSVWNGLGWIGVASGGTFTTQPSVIYVDSENGNDADDGHRIINPKLTIKAAVADANDGDIIIVAPGVYQEILPIDITVNNLSIVGNAQRSCFILPTNATQYETMFRCNSGTYIDGFTFTGLKASGTRGNHPIDDDATYGLPENQGWVAGFYPNCTILKSPYINNCTSYMDSSVDLANFDPNNPAGTGGDTTSDMTGGGIIVDGSVPNSASPLRSFVVNEFTQVNLDGPGLLVCNNGYAQAVSFFGLFCHYHAKALSGGQINMEVGTTNFGRYGLMSDGKSGSTIFTATANGAASTNDTSFTINAPVASGGWFGNATRPGDTMLVEVGGNIYPILSATPSGGGWTVTISNPEPSNRSVNNGLVNGHADLAAVNFYLRSLISASAHTFEYAGSGTNYNALPQNGGVADENQQVIQTGAAAIAGNQSEGAVFYSSTDENGKFKLGETFQVDQKTGFVTVDPQSFSTILVSDTSPQLGGDLDVLTRSITTSITDGDINITPNGTGNVVLDGLRYPEADGTIGQFLQTDGSGNLTFQDAITEVLEDTTPQLGGDLDVNGQSIVSVSNGNIPITPNGTGQIQLTNPQLATNLDIQANAITTTTTDGDIDLDANGAGLIQVTEFNLSQVPVVTQHDIGTAANEVPLNGMLGGMAFQDPTAVSVDDIVISNGVLVADLPTGPVGMIARVTDATTPAVGSTVTGGGAAAALCWYNGTNWTVIGV